MKKKVFANENSSKFNLNFLLMVLYKIQKFYDGRMKKSQVVILFFYNLKHSFWKSNNPWLNSMKFEILFFQNTYRNSLY